MVLLEEYMNAIIQGDCIEIMQEIPDCSVDVVFADPPFNLKKKYSEYYDAREIRDYLSWCKLWIGELVRVTKPTGSILVHNIPKWLIFFGSYLNELAAFRHWIAWNAMGSPLGRTLLPNHYGILYYVKSPTRFKFYDVRAQHSRCRSCGRLLRDYGGKKDQLHEFGPLVSDVWTDIHRIRHNVRRDEHPNQLPVPLMERLLLMTSDPGDIIFDPFLGTGTTAIAAKRLGRRYIGIELDPKYVSIAKRKIREQDPTIVNDCYVSSYLGRFVTIRAKDWVKIRSAFEVPKSGVELDIHSIRLKKGISL